MGLTVERPVFMLPVQPFPLARFLAYRLNVTGLCWLIFQIGTQLSVSPWSCFGY